MTTLRYDVLGIGNAIVDVIARAEDDFLVAQGMHKGTMALIDEARAEQIYAAMGPAVESSGGSAANTIVGVASFGARAAFVGKVNDDELGRTFAHDIRSAGVAYDTPPASEGPSTARCYIMVTPDGERTMNTYLGAAQDLHPNDIDEGQVASAAVTYLEGYLWDPPHAKEAFVKARELGICLEQASFRQHILGTEHHQRNGLDFLSSPTIVSGPCPQSRRVSSGRLKIWVRMLWISKS